LSDSRIRWLNEENDPIKEASSLVEMFQSNVHGQVGQS